MSKSNGHDLPTASFEHLTVDDLRQLLKDSPINPRGKTSDARINLFAAIYRRDGRLAQNGAPFIINDRGQLVDGFHRANGAVLAGVDIDQLVVRGVTEGIFEIDTNSRRTLAQLLRGKGWQYPTNVAGMVNILYTRSLGRDPFGMQTQRGAEGKHAIDRSISAMLTYLNKMKRRVIEATFPIASANSSKGHLLPAAVAMAAFYDFYNLDAEKAAAFQQQLLTGIGLKDGSVQYACRRFFERNYPFNHNTDRRQAYGVLVKAWNHLMAGGGKSSVSLLRFMATEEIPEILGPDQ